MVGTDATRPLSRRHAQQTLTEALSEVSGQVAALAHRPYEAVAAGLRLSARLGDMG